MNVLKDMGLHYKMAKMGNFMKNLIMILKNRQNMAGYKVIAYLVLA